VESPRVYVGNLSYDVSEQDLQELFKGVGPVRNVEIVYNRTTHRSKGYGFVEMLHMDEAIRAVEVLNDQHFMGRKMTVSGAKSKGQDEREESEDRSEGPAAKVVLAPLPAAVEPDPAAVEETVIQTIVENVSPEEPSAEAMVLEEETPAPETTEEPALAEVAAESTEEAPAAEEETKTEVA
jgi:RNA recognition motif-containing protein